MSNNQLATLQDNSILAGLVVPESQKLVVKSASLQIVNVTTQSTAVDEAIRSLRSELENDPRMQELKELKKVKRELKQLHRDAVANYNGAMKVVLADVPGDTLIEKYRTLGI